VKASFLQSQFGRNKKGGQLPMEDQLPAGGDYSLRVCSNNVEHVNGRRPTGQQRGARGMRPGTGDTAAAARRPPPGPPRRSCGEGGGHPPLSTAHWPAL